MLIVEVALFFVIGTTGSFHSQEYQSGVINHDNQVISTTEASCESSGSVHYECKLCGEKTTEEIPAIGHTDDLYCARCGECTFRTLSYSGTGSKAIGCTLPKGKYRVTVTMTSGDGFVDVDVLYSGSGGITSESIRITDAGYWEVATIESSGGRGNIVIQASNDYFGHSGWSIRIELVQ